MPRNGHHSLPLPQQTGVWSVLLFRGRPGWAGAGVMNTSLYLDVWKAKQATNMGTEWSAWNCRLEHRQYYFQGVAFLKHWYLIWGYTRWHSKGHFKRWVHFWGGSLKGQGLCLAQGHRACVQEVKMEDGNNMADKKTSGHAQFSVYMLANKERPLRRYVNRGVRL